ncbi:alpha-glucosidase [Clostridium estertheticum]|uniref:alpha-glucosidase n=1 Tax=Clostridium estertheticum TaxID=238834 RepID=UPI0013E93319|nr:alpha-glucosidase [Clostridium estertheticum]MBZ9687495.1 alpha-glucosidase [Clostridium estertheticum]
MNSLKYTSNSRIKELLQSPIGHDIIAKILLQMGKSMTLVNNPIIRNIRLKQLSLLAPKIVNNDFISTLLTLLNSENDIPLSNDLKPKEIWWKEVVVYQIYPKSFKDSNGDGIGDINGITEKLDYLKSLGVDVIWLSPIYDSPNDDNGYDIRDYRAIMSEFGNMEDFNNLLQKAHSYGLKIIMDLVINHTSDEHTWFKSALKDDNSPYKDYYLWKKSEKTDVPPNNWTSFFSGSAWNYYSEKDQWCLHLFSKKQMDLNWENQALRAELHDMIKWWLSKGIDGFRLDVISYISKSPGLPEGNTLIGEMMGYCGIEHYFYGPRLHEYLKEMRSRTFDNFDVFTVGESPGTGMQMSKLLTADYRKELDMVFSFDHLENPGKVRFDDYRYDLNYLKKILIDWQLNYGNSCWNTLFFENHDNPRMISKINPDPQYRDVLSKLLAAIQFTLKGTPFIFQGQELGMVNSDFKSIDEIKDIESIQLYNELMVSMNKESALRKINAGSRDHARTPMQWNGELNAGFTTGTPWLHGNKDFENCNADIQIKDKNSPFNFYKAIIALRRENKALIYGEFIPVKEKTKDLFCYYRQLDGIKFYIEINLSNKEKAIPKSSSNYKELLSNYTEKSKKLRAYEATIYSVSN